MNQNEFLFSDIHRDGPYETGAACEEIRIRKSGGNEVGIIHRWSMNNIDMSVDVDLENENHWNNWYVSIPHFTIKETNPPFGYATLDEAKEAANIILRGDFT